MTQATRLHRVYGAAGENQELILMLMLMLVKGKRRNKTARRQYNC
jgi:hypothetical protein